jgi:hypothetical protein
LVTSIVTPGTTAPLSSVTTPAIAPVACASSGDGTTNMQVIANAIVGNVKRWIMTFLRADAQHIVS